MRVFRASVCVCACVGRLLCWPCIFFTLSSFIHYFAVVVIVCTLIVLAMHTPDDFEHRKFIQLLYTGSSVQVLMFSCVFFFFFIRCCCCDCDSSACRINRMLDRCRWNHNMCEIDPATWWTSRRPNERSQNDSMPQMAIDSTHSWAHCFESRSVITPWIMTKGRSYFRSARILYRFVQSKSCISWFLYLPSIALTHMESWRRQMWWIQPDGW